MYGGLAQLLLQTRSFDMTYKLVKITDLYECEPHAVRLVETGALIPFDPDNKDYQEYLEWVAEGNTPEPAE